MNDTLAFLGFSTTPLELISFVLSVITVLLNIRRNHWGWLFAIVSSAAYGIVFFRSRLYGDAGLQAVFIAASAWGWYEWLRGSSGGPLAVGHVGRVGLAWSLFGWALGFLLLARFLHAFTDTDVPHMDGFLTAGSLLGTVLTAKKKIESWHTWIAVDILYVGLYVYKGLHLTAILYAVFVVLAVLGLRAWQAAARAEAGMNRMHAGPLRIAILGAESTGKSTLAETLARHYGAAWVPEYLREFVDTMGRVPFEDDQPAIARTQRAREDALARLVDARGLLFCDTTPLMTAVYSRVYWGRVPPALLALEAAHDYALTLVAAPDLPWVPDGLQRESEEVRQRVHQTLLAVLEARGIEYTLVMGDVEARVRRVEELIDARRLAEPLS